MTKKTIIIIGGGPASMMLACSLNANKYNVCIYEKNNALGRKFLVAGKGGFNLTHSEDNTRFIQRYTPNSYINPYLTHFSNTDFRNWLSSIGINTYVGTSKRVFPIKGTKPIEVLNAIEKQLIANGVTIFYNHEWKGWNNEELVFQTPKNQTLNIKPDLAVFALGGASWKVTGSNEIWINYFTEKGVNTQAFYPSNCAYKINWDAAFIEKNHGNALKNCEFKCGNVIKKGEAVITEFGIEGSGIYPLSPEIREQIIRGKIAKLFIDFKPDLSVEEIKQRIENRGRLSIKAVLEKKINLSSVQINLLKSSSSKEEYENVDFLSSQIKSFALNLIDFAPLDDAISTVGGINLNEITQEFELKKIPKHYCIGEMLNWDAPTGGYLLQACFSMGKYLADSLNSSFIEEGA